MDVGTRSKTAYWIGVLMVSVLSGIGHYYKGPSEMVGSGMAGLVLGAACLLSGCNLWVCLLAHGFIDTFGVIALYYRWVSWGAAQQLINDNYTSLRGKES